MTKFMPQSEEQIIKESLIPDKTICDVEIVDAEDTISKTTGNEMIKLTIKVFYEGREFIMFSYITFGDAHMARLTLARSCNSFGIMDAYNKGSISAHDYMGKSGKAKIRLKDDPTYGLKNEIAEFIKRAEPMDKSVSEDEVPF